MSPSFRLPSLVVLLIAAAACGTDSTEPHIPSGMRVLAGGGAVDTVQAQLVQSLVVEVRDSSGQVASGRVVRFTSAPADDPARRAEPTLLFEPLTSTTYAATGILTSDARGQASILVALGTVAGTAHAIVTVPDFGLVDTVTFSVLPGAASKLVISPRDTTVSPSATFVLTAKAIDRLCNTVSGKAITFTPGAGIVSVSSAGQVTVGAAVSRGPIRVSFSATLFDSALVTVLPRLPLVANFATDEHVVALVNLDGTNNSIVATTSDESLSPSSVHATSNIAYYIGDPAGDATVLITSPGGATRVLAGPANGFISAAWPRLSPDGSWVYFTALRAPSSPLTSVWRIHPDGSNLDSLGAFTAAAINTAPAVSPDGATVAVDDVNGLMLINVATNAVRMLSVSCGAPRFSPDGTRIACVRNGALSVMHSDGTGLNGLATPVQGSLDDLSGADWTPDGLWLIVAQQSSNALLVNALTDVAIQVTALPASYSQLSFVR